MARPKSTEDIVKSSVAIPEPIDRIWMATAKKMSLNKTSVLITALRDLAKKEGVLDVEAEETAA